jgi:hypothetical protein
MGEPPVRAKAIRRAIHHRRACDLVFILHHRGHKLIPLHLALELHVPWLW